MDSVSSAVWDLKFRVLMHELKGDEFQKFFWQLMEICHPGDFIKVRAWGRHGDRKNDGYLKSKRTLFQVYAPNEMSARTAIAKIEEDFHGALAYWDRHFDTWVFVHNSTSGLPPDVLKKILDLDQDHPEISVEHWGVAEIKRKLFSLEPESIASLLGEAPTERDFLTLGMDQLKVVLDSISRREPNQVTDLQPVPPEKLKANALSCDVETLLIAGMRKAKLVEEFFLNWHEPTLGEEIAEAFRHKYTELKSEGFPPDEIFYKLQEFAGGNRLQKPEHQAAVFAVLAYLFEACDIYERPREVLS